MPDIADKTSKTLEQLGVRSPGELASLFAELKSNFDKEVAQASTADAWKGLRDHWVGRKRGLLTQAKDNWLLSARAALKPETGKQLNALRAHDSVFVDHGPANEAAHRAAFAGQMIRGGAAVGRVEEDGHGDSGPRADQPGILRRVRVDDIDVGDGLEVADPGCQLAELGDAGPSV